MKPIAACSVCKRLLEPAPARWDGEPTYVGFLPCPEHPRAKAIYPTSELWKKRFGDTPAVGLMDKRVEAFFEELNEVCKDELKQKGGTPC